MRKIMIIMQRFSTTLFLFLGKYNTKLTALTYYFQSRRKPNHNFFRQQDSNNS